MSDSQSPKIVPLPVLKGSSIEDTLAGFADQMGRSSGLGDRVERTLTVVAAEIRGWQDLCDRLGPEPSEALIQQTVGLVVDTIESLGGKHVTIGGTGTQPVVTASFDADNHALRAVVAAESVRDAAARPLHPSLAERLHACLGVSTGTVVDTRVNGAGIEFQATGTLKMFAIRLQEFAGPGQVFISEATYRSIPTQLDVVPIGPVRTNSDGETRQAYCLRGLLPETP